MYAACDSQGEIKIDPTYLPLYTNKIIGLKRLERNRTSNINLIEVQGLREVRGDSESEDDWVLESPEMTEDSSSEKTGEEEDDNDDEGSSSSSNMREEKKTRMVMMMIKEEEMIIKTEEFRMVQVA
uniref:Uncharacterized protein n=1 Tax=Chenopodium quinoa TaxID=63459 RepID=A0A803N572_CHEQI